MPTIPSEIHMLKTEVKINTSASKHYKFQELKVLAKARLFKIISSKEEKDEEAEADAQKSDKFYSIYQNLRHQRTHFLRKHSRNMLLAYGFLRDKPYSKIEKDARTSPDWDKILEIVIDYIFPEDVANAKQVFEEWVQRAKGVEEEPQVKEKVA